MNPASILFLFGFLPIALLLYVVFPKKMKPIVLLLLSLVFYAWGECEYVWILGVSILINYGAGLAIDRFRHPAVLGVSVFANLAFLIAFKYAGFLMHTMNAVLLWWHIPEMRIPAIHMPIGISFFTFKAVSYLVDVYRRQVPANRNLLEVGLYISLFFDITAGPIDRYAAIVERIRSPNVSMETFSAGIQRLIVGLGKKMLLAGALAGVVDEIHQIPMEHLTTELAWFAAIAYTFQIYFDFSGYTDMVIGLGLMFGFTLMENFDYPYISSSVQEFWRRWHISLSTWFRDYLYIPLGGNRRGRLRTYLHLFIVFFLCGLWHGPYWTFVVWGMFHGFFLVLERIGLAKWLDRSWKIVAQAYTFLVVSVGWVFFRSESLANAVGLLQAMFGAAQGDGRMYSLELIWNRHIAFVLGCSMLFSMPVSRWVTSARVRWMEAVSESRRKLVAGLWDFATMGLLWMIMIVSMASLAQGVFKPFIYAQF